MKPVVVVIGLSSIGIGVIIFAVSYWVLKGNNAAPICMGIMSSMLMSACHLAYNTGKKDALKNKD